MMLKNLTCILFVKFLLHFLLRGRNVLRIRRIHRTLAICRMIVIIQNGHLFTMDG
ncbi:hypothetical protein B2K_39600 [Paenibacillus mucilaginosus K02]|uniref:Uncharacterized protein n=1 Tax=Paenibacillus mucilaginosus K02 TaxID=997761 RepID=R9UN81_9BACL|nr:hypothetical protein B2K_39600 [Paenibacillus mucilaginosus K02]